MAPIGRVKSIFQSVLAHARKQYPIPGVTVGFCPTADRDHEKEWRVFAHTGHKEGKVCFAKAAEKDLTDGEIRGISAHEIGHIVAQRIGLPGHLKMETTKGEGTPKKVQEEADGVAFHVFGLPLYYNSRNIEDLSARFIKKGATR